MKTRIPFLIAPLCAAIASWFIASSPAQARYIVTLQQVGPNVVATGSGSIDLTGLTLLGSGLYQASMYPSQIFLVTGPASFVSADVYFAFGDFTGPGAFGPGFLTSADSGSGDTVGFQFRFLFVPQGYISGDPLSDSSIYANQTFSSLGVMPGFRKWWWGPGPDQSFTLFVDATVPDEGSSLMLLSIVLLFLWSLVQKKVVQM